MMPLVAIEGDAAYRRARVHLRRDGWDVVDGFSAGAPDPSPAPNHAVVCAGMVDGLERAQEAVLAALAGAGVLVRTLAPPTVAQLLYEDLRRLGRLQVYPQGQEPVPPLVLAPDVQQLLRLLLHGDSLARAAEQLSMSVRTADRRIASARRFYGVRSTGAALRAASRDLLG